MDAGLAPRGRGWAFAATHGAGPGGVPFFQVTRCKSETISGRYRRNGYVRSQQNIGRPSPASLAPTGLFFQSPRGRKSTRQADKHILHVVMVIAPFKERFDLSH